MCRRRQKRLTQVFSNLLNNAQKFIERGVVSILMKIKRGDEEEESNKSQIEFTIKDTSVGISPDIQPRLFSKFATFSPGGTGLGLYISKNIVEAHGGKMWAENNQGRKRQQRFNLY
jgi:signal transduction histidine kinase